MQDLTFVLGPHHQAAELWALLGDAGITMEAACAFPRLDGRVIHISVRDEDVKEARKILLGAGFPALDQREVVVFDIEPRPGELGRLAARVAATGAKVHLLYMATGNRVVVGADDIDALRSLLD